MGNKKIAGLVLLAVGAVLLYFGFQATDAPLEEARETALLRPVERRAGGLGRRHGRMTLAQRPERRATTKVL